jgi:hypothetical protein
MKVTKEWLQERGACADGYEWFVSQKENRSVKVLRALIADKKLDWANWAIVRVMGRSQYLAYAIYASRQVLDIFEKRYPNDDRPRKAIEAAEAVLMSDTKETRAAANAAAYAIDYAVYAGNASVANLAVVAYTAAAVVYTADYAAYATNDAAYDSAASAGNASAANAASAANRAAVAYAAYAADYAIDYAANAAAYAASGEVANEMRLKILEYGIELLEEDR